MANASPAVETVPGIVFRPNCGRGKLTHPYVVVAICDGVALTVNWTDFLHYEESTCVLSENDHPAIRKTSVMAYPRFKELPVTILSAELIKGEALLRLENVRPDVLERIVDGARKSPDLTNSLKGKFGLVR